MRWFLRAIRAAARWFWNLIRPTVEDAVVRHVAAALV